MDEPKEVSAFDVLKSLKETTKMQVVFLGHGSP